MLSRREFARALLGSAVMGTGALAIGSLSACGRSVASSTSMTVQLSWVKDVSFAGTYIAVNKGYFDHAGVQVALRAGGPNVVVPTVVAAGTALVGMASTDVTAASRLGGSGLRIIGARFQRNPFCIVSLPKTPLHSPGDLAGRRIGVSPTNTLAFQSFLAVNGLSQGFVTQVPVQFDVTPLTSGEVDGLLGYYTSQPILLQSQGVTPVIMLLADHGYSLFENVYIVTEKALDAHRAEIVGFMRGERQGWQDNLADPALGVDLTMTKFGGKDAGLDATAQKQENDSQNKLIRPQGGTPLLGMSDSDIAANLAFLRDRLHIAVDDKLFDTSVLKAL
jgi:ABC-type nitrate/sulfonate/bicarbonate transport system substrate-binding protein